MLLAVGRLFYPVVHLEGELPPGPLLIAPNHPNGLLDGLVLLIASPRRVGFLAKAGFFRNPLLRPILASFDAIPIERRGDRGSQANNQASFAAAQAWLRSQHVLAIFPEGTVNSTDDLLPLRTGAARIALAAEAEADWQAGIQILPLGIWFHDQTRPGSAALLVAGQPIALHSYRTAYQADPYAAAQALTNALGAQLQQLTKATYQRGPQWYAALPPPTRHWFWWPLRLIGGLLALIGLALSAICYWLLTRRHRATVGTARLAALVAGLGLGWLLQAILIGVLFGWWWGLALLLFAPLAGWVAWRS
jgi:1-acyl-sn-glycerol-3-phosphate acyltransferase